MGAKIADRRVGKLFARHSWGIYGEQEGSVGLDRGERMTCPGQPRVARVGNEGSSQ